MNKKSHNKKRNVGIIYEQLILTVSKALIDNDMDKAKISKNIIKKYFRPGTEIYKEHKLFQSLIRTYIKNASLAATIIIESKKAVKNHNDLLLEREKGRLIKEINYSLGKDFYNKRISSYKDFATVQSLFNDWRKSENFKDPQKIAIYESKVHDMLISEKKIVSLDKEKDPDINGLILKIMTEKFNKKYGRKLNKDQTEIIKEYVFSKDKDENLISEKLFIIKSSAVNELSSYMANCNNNILEEKYSNVLEEIKQLKTTDINDDLISKYLTISQLQKELKGDLNE